MYTQQTNGNDVTTWALPEGATVRLGRGQIHSTAFSPDGTHLVVGTRIGCWWYYLNTMTHHALWGTERGMVCAISFSHDARWIAIGDWDGIVKIWDTQNLQCVKKIDVPGNSMSRMSLAGNLTFSRDGQHLTFSNAISYRGGIHCTVHDWQTNINTPIDSFTVKPKPDRRYIHPTAFSPDGHLFAYTSDANMTYVLDVKTGEHVAELPDDYTEQSKDGCDKLVFSPCGQYLAACNQGNSVHVWNIHNGTYEMPPTPYGEDSYIQYGIPSYSSDGNLRVAGIGSSEVVIWDATLQDKVGAFESWNPDRISACFSNDGTRFAVANGRGELHVWTEDTPSKVTYLPKHLRDTGHVGFSKDNLRLVSYHQTRAGVTVWDVARQQVEERQTFHYQYKRSTVPGGIVLSKSRKLLATTEEKEHTLKIWDLVSNTQIADLPTDRRQVNALKFSPTGEYLVGAVHREPYKVWHVMSGIQVAELDRNSSSPVSRVKMAFSRSGEYFVTVYNKSFTVWNVYQWEKRYHKPLTIQNYHGLRLIPYPNSKRFITIPLEGDTLVWEFESGEKLGSLDTTTATPLDTSLYRGTSQNIQRVFEHKTLTPRHIWSLRFSPCGHFIIGGMKDEIRVWDTTTLEIRMAIIPPAECCKPYALAFSPCGNYFAAGSRWQEGENKVAIRLWDITSGENIHTFWGHPTDVLSLNFSPDGTLLASGSYDGTILLWDMKPYLKDT